MKATATSSRNSALHMANLCVRTLVFASVTALLGCSTPFPQLPDITALPDKLLNNQQQNRMGELAAKGQEHQSNTAKAIENEK
jgi:hypothetical protein